jgi:hypothetical protein
MSKKEYLITSLISLIELAIESFSFNSFVTDESLSEFFEFFEECISSILSRFLCTVACGREK